MGVLNCNFCDNICCNILCYHCRDHYICDSCLGFYKKNLSDYINNNKLHEKITQIIQKDDYMCKKCIKLIVSKTESVILN